MDTIAFRTIYLLATVIESEGGVHSTGCTEVELEGEGGPDGDAQGHRHGPSLHGHCLISLVRTFR